MLMVEGWEGKKTTQVKGFFALLPWKRWYLQRSPQLSCEGLQHPM